MIIYFCIVFYTTKYNIKWFSKVNHVIITSYQITKLYLISLTLRTMQKWSQKVDPGNTGIDVNEDNTILLMFNQVMKFRTSQSCLKIYINK